jgi:hypothetical protein
MDVIFWNGGISGSQWKILSRSIGPYKIAYWIRKHGYNAQVIDFVDQFSEEEIYLATTKFITSSTKILALSTTFISNRSPYPWSDGTHDKIPEPCVKVIKRIKKEHPQIKIVLGGYASDQVSGWAVVDATVMSYNTASEDIFLEYLDHLTKGTPAPYGQLIFPNWGTENRKHRMLYDRAREPKYNIETDDFKWAIQDAILPNEPLPLDVSRGCIFACLFCQYAHLGKKKLDYIRGMNFIEEEIRYNFEQFGTTIYYMIDDTFNDTEFKIQEFYNMTQRLPFKIEFGAYLRADLIHRFPNMATLLQESGLHGAYHGIETFNPSASKLVGKAWSGTHAKKWLPELYHNIWGGKIPMHNNFIVGFPGDKRENVLDTAQWHLDNNMHSIQFKALGLFGPGNDKSRYTVQSEFDKNAEKYGFKLNGKYGLKGGILAWENADWNLKSATAVADEATEIVFNKKKTHTWQIPSLRWYGISKDEISTVPHADFSWEKLSATSKNLYQQYLAKVMDL